MKTIQKKSKGICQSIACIKWDKSQILYICEIHGLQLIQDHLAGKILSQIFFKIPVYHQGKKTDEKMCSYACVSMDKYRSCFKIRFHDAETFFNFPTPFTDRFLT